MGPRNRRDFKRALKRVLRRGVAMPADDVTLALEALERGRIETLAQLLECWPRAPEGLRSLPFPANHFVLDLLMGFGLEPVSQRIADLLTTPEDDFRWLEVSRRLAWSDSPGVAETCLRVMSSPERPKWSRVAAVRAVGGFGGRAAVPAMVAVLTDADAPAVVRGQAAEELGTLCPRYHSTELDEDRQALRAELVLFPDAEAFQLWRSTGAPLEACLGDPNPRVRFWAAYAIGILGYFPALPRLEEMRGSDNAVCLGWWTLREEANFAIAGILGRPWESPPRIFSDDPSEDDW